MNIIREIGFGVGIFVGIVCLFVLIRMLLLWRIRSRLDMATNKVPMEICEKNHLYPVADALIIDVPEIPHPMHLCPYCYANNLKNAERFKE